jgi:ABC-2 type transport system permease protein
VSTATREARAGLAILRRDFDLVRRYLSWELVFLFYNVVNVLSIALIAYLEPAQKRSEIILYLSIGALLWGFLSVLFQEIANAVSVERWEGTIETAFMAPMHRLTYLIGTSAYALVYGLVRTGIALLAIALFFHLSFAHARALPAAAILAASCLPFVGLGLVAAVLPVLSTERGAQATQVLQGILLLVSGVYYPISVLPGWIRWLGEISPATYTLEAERAALLSGSGWALLGPDFLRLLLSGALLIPLGLWGFSLGEQHALRTGRLKRNG